MIHCEGKNKPNMHFRMQQGGIPYYEPDEDFTFVTTISDNKKTYSKLHIK